MQAITHFSVAAVDDDTGGCVIAFGGRALPASFAGATLEAQFALTNNEFLLVLSDADPYDAGLHIYLLNSAHVVLDALTGGGAFQPGVFKLRDVFSSSFRFDFFTNDAVYELTVADQAKLHFVAAGGWRYPSKLKLHRLIINVSP